MNAVFAAIFILSAAVLLVVDPSGFLPALLDGATRSATLSLSLLATYAAWLGLMKLWEESGVARGISKLLKPLCRKLFKFAARQKTASGAIFRTKSGKAMSRYQIWSKMKKLCVRAGVDAGKVFPHNLRHLFATAFYRAYKDIVKLADVLGHSSIETTRIYLVTSVAEHWRQLERLRLVS